MTSRRSCSIGLAIAACMTFAGCMPKMTLEEMKSMMPQRPAELDKLNDFVGRWDFTGEANMAFLDEPVSTTGTGESHLDDSGWFLVGNSVFKMQGFDDLRAHDTWTYDTHSKKYRSTWVDSMGSTGTGTSTHNEKTNTWTMRATSHGPYGKTVMKGCIKVIDDDTMEWCWSEYALGGLLKTMEICGTSKRN